MFVLSGNASQAYRMTYDCEGSSRETSHRESWQLTHNPKVAKRIKELTELHEKGVIVTRPAIQQKLLNLTESECETVALNACKELSKHLGLHKTRVEHTVEGELNHRHLHLQALKMVNGEAKRVHEIEMAQKRNKQR